MVGYVAIVSYQEKVEKTDSLILNQKAQEEALNLARQTLEGYLKDKSIPQVKIQNSVLQQKLGAFVTLNKVLIQHVIELKSIIVDYIGLQGAMTKGAVASAIFGKALSVLRVGIMSLLGPFGILITTVTTAL